MLFKCIGYVLCKFLFIYVYLMLCDVSFFLYNFELVVVFIVFEFIKFGSLDCR